MKSKIVFVGITASCLLLTGCASMMAPNPYSGQSQINDTTKGAGIGAAGGGIVGALVGGKVGALVGAGVGGLAGGFAGHYFDNENAALRQQLVGTGVQIQQQGNSIKLIMASDVTFNTNQSEIRSGFYPTLNSVATVLKKYDKTSIVIKGYTDNVGGNEYNQVLSEKRARSVADYLIAQDISADRIFSSGLGKRDPIANNATAQGRAQNRRVEITLRPQS